MSGASHTPGPWRLAEETREVFGPDKDRTICRAHLDSSQRDYFETVANARLIAAAPDYDAAAEQAVEALNAMMDAWFDYHDAHSLTQPVTGAAGNAFDKALAARETLEAAIAKARGEA